MTGWIGSICLSLCVWPQACRVVEKKSAEGLSFFFWLLWTVGELCLFAYVLPNRDWPLLLNYVSNLFGLAIIGWFLLKDWLA